MSAILSQREKANSAGAGITCSGAVSTAQLIALRLRGAARIDGDGLNACAE
jgi:hypothetical protein